MATHKAVGPEHMKKAIYVVIKDLLYILDIWIMNVQEMI